MKKIIVILAVLFCAANAFSQETTSSIPKSDYAKHRLHIYGSAGYTNNIYNRVADIHANCSYSAMFEMKYAFFFAPKWGVSLGAGVSRFAAKGTLNINNILKNYEDPLFTTLLSPMPDDGKIRDYDLYYKTNNLVEKQEILALEVPLQFHFEHKVNKTSGIFASLGATGYFPIISAQTKFPKGNGTLETWAYEGFTNCWYRNDNHFGDHTVQVVPAKAKMRISADLVAEFGGIFRISEIADFYLGAYGTYGFLDILPKDKDPFIALNPADKTTPFVVNSLLKSDYMEVYNNGKDDADKVSEKWNRWQVGLKVGFHIKPLGKKARQEKRLRDAQKEFYQDASDYMKKGGKDDGGSREPQIIYIYNITPQGFMEDKNIPQNEKDNINDLADAFSKVKILFDLDSDVPKIDNRQYVLDAAEVLRKDQSLSVVIEGYTCDLGSEKHNRELAKRRANAIRDIFIKQGVSPKQITISGYTVADSKNQLQFKGANREEHRAVIFRIVKQR